MCTPFTSAYPLAFGGSGCAVLAALLLAALLLAALLLADCGALVMSVSVSGRLRPFPL